jgi:hypothetical protein
MPGLSFINAWMLAGLAALAIPVLIHLLLRRKKKRLRFSTLQFFEKHDEQSAQRRKLRHWLLLALRLLVVALLVLAFARPFRSRPGTPGAAPQPQQIVFVLDRSVSMQAAGTDGPRWVRAKERLQKVLGGLGADDRAALVGCAGRAEVLAGFAPAPAVARTLAELQPGWGGASLSEGLQQAVRLVSLGDPGAISTLYLVSDLQRSSCESLASCPIPLGIQVKLLPVGDLLSPNLAVTRLEPDPENGARPHVVVNSYSDEDSRDVRLEVRVDGQVAASSSINLKSGAVTNVEFALPPLPAGWHGVEAALRSRDALPADDRRHAVLFVPEPMRVVVVEGRKAARVFDGESFFVTLALDPAKATTNNTATPCRVEQTTPEQLVSRLSGPGGALPCDLVILPGLGSLPPGCGPALHAFVQAGGGLLLFLGDGMSVNRCNTELRDVLPATLGDRDAGAEPGLGWRIGDFDTNNVVFAPFGRAHSGDLRIPEFTQRQLLTPGRDAVTLARFEDGVPLVLTRRLGRGRVVLVNTSADTRWCDWPKHKTFVPWLHGLARYLAPKTGSDQLPETRAWVAGGDHDLELGPGARQSRFRLHSPQGQDRDLVADDQGRLRDPGLAAPGIYSLRGPGEKEVRRLAVNVPTQESDLAALTPTEFQNQLVRVPDEPKTTLGAGLFGSSRNRREFWAVLLLAVLALLFLETLWANRTSA